MKREKEHISTEKRTYCTDVKEVCVSNEKTKNNVQVPKKATKMDY